MEHHFEIRPYRKEDLSQIEALEARIQPYRPEDQSESKIYQSKIENDR